ncbi:Serine/threonine-protein kinase-transforming protein Rmil [Hypsizygus marmoreus]|uniref:Serine/threonine-protein kinase-transforming protein Rmil n=1 Tax=Hypsizygus marmoreus TaxID=39966 RepID=A0A369K5K6_HYPMA|nr:Serine/threonine-protein kinase-transforming protein Rmil [Hypsizygus marmoreus]
MLVRAFLSDPRDPGFKSVKLGFGFRFMDYDGRGGTELPSQVFGIRYVHAAEAMSNIKAWVKESDELSTLCWFTHPNNYERSVVASQVATYCEELGILSPRLFLSRRQDVRDWNLAYLLVCQLCHFIPGLQPLHVDPQIMHHLPFENLEEDWIREFFVTPLMDQTSFPMVIIVDSLDMSKLELLRPLTILAMMLKDTPALPVRLLLTTHPDIRTQTVVGPHMAINRFLKEVHVVYPLHKLLDLRIKWDEQPAYSRLVLGPLEANKKFQTPTPNLRPLVLFALHKAIRYSLSNVLKILEELGTIFDLNAAPELWAVLEKDDIEDQKLYIAILREVLRSNADAPQELSDAEAQLLVDFSQQLVDSGVLLKTSGHDFDRRVRRLILKVAKASDTLPASMFLQEGVRLIDPEPYAGGGYSDIYRATYNGQNVALKRLRVYRNNPDRERTNRVPFKFYHVIYTLLTALTEILSGGSDMATTQPSAMFYPFSASIQEHFLATFANILVDDDMHIRLSDFGLTVFSDASVDTQTDNAGCILWMAPELFISEDEQEILQKTCETDVYAFACVYYELYSGLRPFDELPLDATVIHSVSRGFRPDRPLDEGDSIRIPEPVWELIVDDISESVGGLLHIAEKTEQSKPPAERRVVPDLYSDPRNDLHEDVGVASAMGLGVSH